LFGWFMVVGMVFCMQPTLSYVVGCCLPGIHAFNAFRSIRWRRVLLVSFPSFLEFQGKKPISILVMTFF
jgi:hypothetical protein